jgi:predicted lipoprotein with Yx(FWY)xxD motif
MRKWQYVPLAGAAAVMLLATACGAQNTQANGTNLVQPAAGTAAATAPSVVASTAGTTTQAETAGELAVKADAKLGSIVTDSAGRTLYRFDKDTPSPSASNCNGDCAVTWPPVPANDATASASLNPDLVGSVTRADGTKQLTLDGWPMYRFAKDTAPGDTNGQGVGGTWFASAPDGKKAGVSRPELGVLNSPTLGKVLQDKNGKTIYLFTKDTPWPMKTACDATCLQKWTPVAPVDVAAAVKSAGISPTALFTFNNPNGVKQEAFNCWPGYTFKGDTEAGQTNGQGVGGVWFAITQKIKVDKGKTKPAATGTAGSSTSTTTTATSSASTSSSGTGGY